MVNGAAGRGEQKAGRGCDGVNLHRLANAHPAINGACRLAGRRGQQRHIAAIHDGRRTTLRRAGAGDALDGVTKLRCQPSRHAGAHQGRSECSHGLALRFVGVVRTRAPTPGPRFRKGRKLPLHALNLLLQRLASFAFGIQFRLKLAGAGHARGVV